MSEKPDNKPLILVDGSGTQHLDCADTRLPFGEQLLTDIRERSETAMSQEHCFTASELALRAQALAEAEAETASVKEPSVIETDG